MSVTWAQVEAIAPEITGLVPVGAQTYYLAFVDRQISDEEWAERADDGRLWLAAHYGSKYATAAAAGSGGGGGGGVGPVLSETLGPMSRTYGDLSSSSSTAGSAAAGDLGTTRYGLEYLRQIQLLPCSLGFVP